MKHNDIFNRCLANVDPEIKKEVRENMDKLINNKSELTDFIYSWFRNKDTRYLNSVEKPDILQQFVRINDVIQFVNELELFKNE